jgi:hypothetical protein
MYTARQIDAGPSPAGRLAGPRAGPRRVAHILAAVVALTMATASAAGLLIDGIYHEDAWALAALRGGDLVTLAVATPALILGFLMAARGSIRAVLVWAAVLAYNIYNFAYYAFGAAFNDLFLAHIALLGLSTWGLVFLLVSVDPRPLVGRLSTGMRVATATVLTLIAAGLTGLWSQVIIRQALTGQLPQDAANPAQMHLVYAIDLGVFVPMLVVAAWLLWHAHPWGMVAGATTALAGATYLLNLIAAQAFQAAAQVPGVAAFSPLSGALVCVCAAAGIGVLRAAGRRR